MLVLLYDFSSDIPIFSELESLKLRPGFIITEENIKTVVNKAPKKMFNYYC